MRVAGSRRTRGFENDNDDSSVCWRLALCLYRNSFISFSIHPHEAVTIIEPSFFYFGKGHLLFGA